MKHFNFITRWISQIVEPYKFKKIIPNFFSFFRDWKRYSKMKGAEQIKLVNSYPFFFDKTKYSSFDPHYFYQDIWAFKKILKSKFNEHIDVGSRIIFVGFLSTIKKVTFVDIRPLITKLENFKSKKGNLLHMPYESDSVFSLSCLHVAEHVGLGRYGDQLDPLGTKKATYELSRILAPGGNLYFSLPIGKPKLCFNAHRIHSTKQILNYFSDLTLIELSGIDDEGNFKPNIDRTELDLCNFGCGLFWFRKE